MLQKNTNKVTSETTAQQPQSFAQRLKLAKRNKERCAMIDISGSMMEHAHDGKTKIEIVNDLLKKLPAEGRKFTFNDYVTEVRNESRLQADYGTNMTAAFNYAKDEGFKEIILLTDGIPDHPPFALMAAKDLIIHVVYIGPPPIPQFLYDLTGQTLGSSFKDIALINDEADKELEEKVIKLLTE